jgi:transposase
MAYHEVTAMEKWDIFRRWHTARQSIRSIAHTLGIDRKTVRRIITHLQDQGLSRDTPLPDRATVMRMCEDTTSTLGRTSTAQILLEPYLDETKSLITSTANPLQAKIAFEVLCTRHGLADKVSYSSFKRFMHSRASEFTPLETTCRMETPPGDAVQIDYGYVGLRKLELEDRQSKVYLFIATLACSRHKYVEVVRSQNQQSFVSSNVRMLSYFGGVPRRLVIDNLKAGVIKPDLYDPILNRAYQEMAEHYDTFIDPCRPYSPKDKWNVESDVKTIRAQYNKFCVLHPDATVFELTDFINEWLRDEYGQRKHGTTQMKPYPVYLQEERPALHALPERPFEIACWKNAKVHPDQHVQFNKQAFSVPQAYVLRSVWIRGTEKTIQIYFDNHLIQQHVRTERYRHTDISNYPQNVRAVLDEGFPLYLQEQAGKIGPLFKKCIRSVLQVNAFINMRRAQGLVKTGKAFPSELVESAAQYVLDKRIPPTVKSFKLLLFKFEQQAPKPILPMSEETKSFTRPFEYYSQAHNN